MNKIAKQLYIYNLQTNPDLNILDLKNAEVNLICRSIANRDSYTDIKTLADRNIVHNNIYKKE